MPPAPAKAAVPKPAAAAKPAAAPKAAPAAKAGLSGDKKRLALVGAFVVIVVLGLIFVPGFFRTVKELPYVASARVASQQGVLHEEANATSKSVASVQRSTLVHVLALPKSLTTGFAQVQARDGDSYTRAGYIPTTDLIEWESKDSKVALALARLSGPMDAGSDAEMRAQIDRLNSVAATFQGKPEANAAALDAAKLEFALVKRAKDANPASTDWQSSLSDLSSRLEPLRRDAATQSGADDLLRQIHDLMASAPPVQAQGQNGTQGTTGQGTVAGQGSTGSTTGPPTPDEIKGWLQNAERLRKSYRYPEAKYFVQLVLKADPTNADAKKLLEKINAAIELEKSAQ
jgi:hypothetical protein